MYSIDEIERMLEGITSGPWISNDMHSNTSYPWRIESDADGYPNSGYAVALLKGPDAENNSEFIASSPEIIRQLLAERSQIRRQAFEEAATIADTMRRNGYIFVGDELRRKAEEGEK